MVERNKTYKAIEVQRDRSLKIVDVEFPQQIKDDQVLVKIIAAPINPVDLMRATGKYGAPSRPPYGTGLEGSGIVTQVGKKHAQRLKVGDRVTVLNEGKPGTWAEYIVTSGERVFPLHPDLSFEEAASHFVNPATVSLMLKEVQKEGHKVVVQSAAGSSLGKMMIRLFKENGIKTINLVRRDDIKQELLDIGADYVLNFTDPDFDSKFRELVEKEHPTKYYEAVGGRLTPRIVRLLPRGSKINLYGLLDGFPKLSVCDFLSARKKIRGFDVQKHYRKLTFEEKIKFASKIQELLKSTLKTVIVKTFPLAEFEQAIEHSSKFASTGKTIFKIQDSN